MRRHGFTLVEVLVTIGIIVLMIALVIISIKPFSKMVRGGQTANALSVAIDSARAESQRGWTGTPPYTYDGAAVIVEADRFVLAMSDRGSDRFLSHIDHALAQFRFDHEPLTKTDEVFIFGLHRDDTSPDAQLIEPPFAIWFTPAGQTAVGLLDFEGQTVQSVISYVVIDADDADLSRMPNATEVMTDNPEGRVVMLSHYSGERSEVDR
jgi:hypothetical protein